MAVTESVRWGWAERVERTEEDEFVFECVALVGVAGGVRPEGMVEARYDLVVKGESSGDVRIRKGAGLFFSSVLVLQLVCVKSTAAVRALKWVFDLDVEHSAVDIARESPVSFTGRAVTQPISAGNSNRGFGFKR